MLKIIKGDSGELDKILESAHSGGANVAVAVAEIIAAIREKGDEALNYYTRKFDNSEHQDGDFLVSKKEIETAFKACDKESIKALELVQKRVADYHQRQLPSDHEYTDDLGMKLGWRWTPVDSAGIYVPGGLASYPSSVLMNAIPAQAAGVKRIAMVVPKPKPLVLAAAKICGIDEIYKIGGAQAVAALAYGTESIKPVVKIVGPGNSYVAEAKRQVFGKVGIDSIAGPSEILVIADDSANPDWVAADLLSQAEHSGDARAVLISASEKTIKAVNNSLAKLLATLNRKEIAAESIRNNGLAILVKDLDEAATIANKIATEHLELMVEDPKELYKKITNAGAVFLGGYSSEAIGDYVAGPSHVLPTAGSAKFSSGLGVYDFLKRNSVMEVGQEAFSRLAPATERLAREEGLDAHALSVTIRGQK